MVRSAGAQNPVDGFLKGAATQKRAAESSPLDLSSGSPVVKKVKRERDSIYSAESLLSLPLLDAIRTRGKTMKRVAASGGTRLSPMNNSVGDSRCTESEQHSIAHWTVDDVCSFVTSIEICAEYEKVSFFNVFAITQSVD